MWTTASRGVRSRVEVAFPPGEPVALKVGAGLVTSESAAFQPVDEQMGRRGWLEQRAQRGPGGNYWLAGELFEILEE